jgi:polyhydroxyalkanoate synthase
MTTSEAGDGKGDDAAVQHNGDNAPSLERLNANLARIEDLSQRLIAAMAARKPTPPSLSGPGQDLFLKASAAMMAEMVNNPARMIEHQVGWWGRALKHAVEAQHLLATGKLTPPEDPSPKDRRFANPLWDSHPWFNYLKQQYLMSAEAITATTKDVEGLSETDHKRLDYFTRQIVDMMSPTNFLATNPDALTRAVETEGESLVKGLENLVRDIESHQGDMVVTLADPGAFRVGENLATTKGAVVWRNRLFELIQYAPTTETVHRTPMIIFPPWINKFYILDLKPANSLIKWIVDQGYTLFVVSWVNPDETFRDTGIDDYVREGYLAAIEQVKAITGEDQVNAIGYCIAGTTLAMTLALMQQTGDDSVRSATFFTTLTDFSDQGEMAVFLTDDFVDGIEREVAETGMLRAYYMARTFSYLRSNDLIYQPAIRSYMLGEAPPAFDLLYWNGDSTNLPAKMAVEYLRGLCQGDRFAQGGYPVLGRTVTLKDVKVPLCAIACETDHIAAWKSSYSGIQQMGSRSKRFILSESGHIAGIVNPPSKKKYGHYLNPDLTLDPEAWQKGADYREGSWWPEWEAWLAKRSGAKVPARAPGGPAHPILASAPGTFVVAVPDGDSADGARA